jgi:hypothetical protein
MYRSRPHAHRRRQSGARLAFLLAFVSLALPLVPIAPASAASNGKWALLPYSPDSGSGAARSNFSFEVKPGQTITDKVSLFNQTDAPISFRLYGADAYNTTPGGGFALRNPDDKKLGVGAWVSTAVSDYTMAPQTRTDIPVTITVPVDATPGDHAGGIVALNINPEETRKAGNATYNVKRAVGVRVYARVAGPLKPAIDLANVHLATDAPLLTPLAGTGSAKLGYTLVNTGNTRVAPKIHIEISDAFGRTVRTFDNKKVPELLPGGRVTVIQPWASLPILGVHYTAKVTATADGAHAVAESSAWVVPWVLILLLVLIVGGWYLLRRRRRARPRPPSPDRALSRV